MSKDLSDNCSRRERRRRTFVKERKKFFIFQFGEKRGRSSRKTFHLSLGNWRSITFFAFRERKKEGGEREKRESHITFSPILLDDHKSFFRVVRSLLFSTLCWHIILTSHTLNTVVIVRRSYDERWESLGSREKAQDVFKRGKRTPRKKWKEVNFCSPTFWKLLFYSSSVHLRIYWNFSTSQLSTNVWATQDYSRLRANYFCGVHSIRNKSLTFTTLLWQLNHYILKIDYSKVFSFRTGTQFFGNVQNFLYFLLFCCFQF